jgi:chloride channel 2
MYGRYTRNLGDFARVSAQAARELERSRKKEETLRRKELRPYHGKWASRFLRGAAFIWRHSFAKIGEDWVFLALLGIIMALLSFAMDYGVSMCNSGNLCKLYANYST